MPFRPPRKKPEFADLKGVLNQSAKTDNALHQTTQILIERLQLLQNILSDELDPESPNSQFATKYATYWTKENHITALPNSRQALAGTGITLDYTTFGQVTISASASGGAYAPMSTGAEPLEIMSDGAGAVLMIGFTP